MRLINTSSFEMCEFIGSNIPPYAIVSHTWGGDEVTYQAYAKRHSKAGNEKIDKCCALASLADISYLWIDTCCIDKSSSAELTEAINSMYQWYKNSEVCYVYLCDMSGIHTDRESGSESDWLDKKSQEFCRCRWFRRGWT